MKAHNNLDLIWAFRDRPTIMEVAVGETSFLSSHSSILLESA